MKSLEVEVSTRTKSWEYIRNLMHLPNIFSGDLRDEQLIRRKKKCLSYTSTNVKQVNLKSKDKKISDSKGGVELLNNRVFESTLLQNKDEISEEYIDEESVRFKNY